MTIFERLEEWKHNGSSRGWELRGLASGQYLVALFDGSRFVCDGKWNTPDGAFEAARFRFEKEHDPKALAHITSQEKEAYLQAVR